MISRKKKNWLKRCQERLMKIKNVFSIRLSYLTNYQDNKVQLPCNIKCAYSQWKLILNLSTRELWAPHHHLLSSLDSTWKDQVWLSIIRRAIKFCTTRRPLWVEKACKILSLHSKICRAILVWVPYKDYKQVAGEVWLNIIINRA